MRGQNARVILQSPMRAFCDQRRSGSGAATRARGGASCRSVLGGCCSGGYCPCRSATSGQRQPHPKHAGRLGSGVKRGHLKIKRDQARKSVRCLRPLLMLLDGVGGAGKLVQGGQEIGRATFRFSVVLHQATDGVRGNSCLQTCRRSSASNSWGWLHCSPTTREMSHCRRPHRRSERATARSNPKTEFGI
jgi:hypothetical protein